MNENEIMELLFKDISDMELPPLSEKVLGAAREKNNRRDSSRGTSEQKSNGKGRAFKWFFAAILTASVVSVPMIVVMSDKKNDGSICSDAAPSRICCESALPEPEISDTCDVSLCEEESDVLEHISIVKLHGTVSLSGRSEAELETMLEHFSPSNGIYEDEEFLYNFNSQGKLVEMCRSELSEYLVGSSVREDIAKNAENTLRIYYPEFKAGAYETDIQGSIKCHPAWIVTFTRTNSDLSRQSVIMTFDSVGDLQRMFFAGSADDIGKITRAEAVRIVLGEIHSEKYNISGFKNEDFKLIADYYEKDGRQYYEVIVSVLPQRITQENMFFLGYQFLVDAETGELTFLDYC